MVVKESVLLHNSIHPAVERLVERGLLRQVGEGGRADDAQRSNPESSEKSATTTSPTTSQPPGSHLGVVGVARLYHHSLKVCNLALLRLHALDQRRVRPSIATSPTTTTPGASPVGRRAAR